MDLLDDDAVWRQRSIRLLCRGCVGISILWKALNCLSRLDAHEADLRGVLVNNNSRYSDEGSLQVDVAITILQW
jgi:hypothetical protein